MDLSGHIRAIIAFTNKRIKDETIDWPSITDQDELVDLHISNKFVLLETEFVHAKLDSLRDRITDVYPKCSVPDRVHHLSVIYLLDAGRRGCRVLKQLLESNLKKIDQLSHPSFENSGSDDDIEMWDAAW